MLLRRKTFFIILNQNACSSSEMTLLTRLVGVGFQIMLTANLGIVLAFYVTLQNCTNHADFKKKKKCMLSTLFLFSWFSWYLVLLSILLLVFCCQYGCNKIWFSRKWLWAGSFLFANQKHTARPVKSYSQAKDLYELVLQKYNMIFEWITLQSSFFLVNHTAWPVKSDSLAK